MLIMLPLPCFCMTRTSCFMLRITPRTFVSKVAAKLSAVCSVIGPTWPSVPALFTATSRRPNRATVLSTIARTSSSLRTSALMNSASVPSERNSSMSALPASSRRPETTTFAPLLAKATAAARPMPVNAPVINTTDLLMISVLQGGGRWTEDVIFRRFAKWAIVPIISDFDVRNGALWMDSLGALNAFVRAAEARSFTVAGRQLGVSSSAIGKAIARMEERLGARLFHRSTRSITLTAEGALFLERCRRIFAEIEAAELELSQMQEAPRGTLRVSLPLAGTLMMPTLVAFMRAYPEIMLDLDFS